MKRNKKKATADQVNTIAEAFCSVTDLASMRQFFDEIFTPAERDNIALRWHLMKLLVEGVSQRKISSALGISLCKITRGSKILKDSGSVTNRIIKRQTKSGETNGPEDLVE